jgi:hypothetical protein
MNIYKMIRLFVCVVSIAFIVGQVFYIYSNDIYMYEQNVQYSDLHYMSPQSGTNESSDDNST